MLIINPIVEPLNEFWESYYNDEFFIWIKNKLNPEEDLLTEIKRYNLN